MNAFANRYTTPFLTGLFLVSTVSGIALFFHWLPGTFHAMHEWLSMILIIPFGFHVWKNWRAMIGYLKRKQLVIPLVISLVAAIIFVVPGMVGGGGGGNPAFRVLSVLIKAPIAELAPVLDIAPDDLVGMLNQRGLTVTTTRQNLQEITAGGEISAQDILISLLPAPSR